MEWIRISQNKIKVMLTAEDAAYYALSPIGDNQAGALAKKAFRAILSDVRDSADFDATEDKVYVQLYPSRTGGLELFITKMGVELERESSENAPTYQKCATRELTLAFEDCRALIAVCRRLLQRGFIGESSAFLDDARRYWLLLRERGAPTKIREDYRFAVEYGKIDGSDSARILLAEHGRCICPTQAVEKLGVL